MNIYDDEDALLNYNMEKIFKKRKLISYIYMENIINYNENYSETTFTPKLGLTHTKPQIFYLLPLFVFNFLIF